ncbi:MAG: fibronectin type III domain-containing protein [Lachnospiraceae bacterium]
MLGRRGRKERKRLMALLLAGAMVLSGMGISPISVQAEETEPVVEQVSETVSDGNAERAREVLGEGRRYCGNFDRTQDANAAMAAAQSGTEKDLYELDLSKGLTAGTTYDGGISVLETMSFKSGSASLDGVKYTGCVQGDNSPNPNKGKIPTSGAAVRLEAEKDGRIKVVFKAKGKDIYFLQDVDGKPQGIETFKAGADLIAKTYEVEKGGTYYLYASGSKIMIYALTVDYRSSVSWDDIAAPVLGTPFVKDGTITVPYTAQIGGIYAKSLEVTMYDADGNAVETKSVTAQGTSGNAEFQPTASGTYSFEAKLIGEGENTKASNKTTSIEFVLPMATPKGLNAENKGHGNVKLTWQAVAEAESYKVSVDGTVVEEGVTALAQTIKGLTVGQEYTFQVAAVRGENVSTPAEVKLTITEDAVKTWNFAAFGQGVDNKTANNGYSGSLDTGDLKIWEKNSKGKLVAASTDGLAFYYTTIDPATENFTLSADITVDEWTYTNGQEGFGLMAADRVGENGDSGIFWNNSYMLSATKVEYLWDATEGKVSDAGDKYTMKLGIGSQEKIGVTPENMNDSPTDQGFRSTMTTLETSAANSGNGAGTYNIVGKYTNSAEAVKDITDLNVQTTFHMILQRNNTGYFLSYTNVETGETVTNKYYHGKDGDELTRLDAENIYVGFFASRTATISVANAVLTTIDPAKDAPAESRPVTYVTPNYTIDSASVANSADYELVYYGNADGTLKITNSDNETVLSDAGVKANTKVYTHTTLKSGSNVFHVEFTPNADYRPSEYSLLSSYDTVTFDFTVNYNVKGRTVIYAAPEGRSTGSGTNSDPVDIYTAVKSVAPGQMIVLKGGTYALDKTVTIDRGVSGTTDARIYMIADPDSTSRPVLNFTEKMCRYDPGR